MRQTKFLRQGLGEEGRLVVPTLALPCVVQRDRHHNVGRQVISRVSHYASQLFRKPCPERAYLFKFQEQNRTHERVFVDRKASGAVKRVRFVQASRAENLLRSSFGETRQRPSASFTYDCWQTFKRGKAIFAYGNAAGRKEQPITDAASSGQKDTADGVSRFD